jgi:uncharacterized protein (DUF58 family)
VIRFLVLIPGLLLKPFKVLINTSFERWLSRRNPQQFEHQLSSRNIIIYPSRFGFAYLVFVVLLFLLATNYQNNIILLVSYLLVSLFITVMLHSFYNITKLSFSSVAQQSGYANDTLYFPIYVKTTKIHYDINAFFSNRSLPTVASKIEQCQLGSNVLNLTYKATSRGQHRLGRVTVFSEYSMGLFVSKSILDFGHYALVYPQPKTLQLSELTSATQTNEDVTSNYQTSHTKGSDDFFELKKFVMGESNSSIAWKQEAKGRGRFSKHYHQYQSQLVWLSITDMPGHSIEMKLSYLSFLVSELTALNQEFGLALSRNINDESTNIAPGAGITHQQTCLTALALY